MKALRIIALVLLAVTVAALGVGGGLVLRNADHGRLFAVDAGPHGGAPDRPTSSPGDDATPSPTQEPSSAPAGPTEPAAPHTLPRRARPYWRGCRSRSPAGTTPPPARP